MRRKNIILLTIAFFFTGTIYSQWMSESFLTTDNLNSIALLDSTRGWIVGNNGSMLFKNQDSWTICKRITEEDLLSVCLIDSNNGWAVGANGTILYYDGSRWKNFESPTMEKLYSVSFSDTSNGVAVGSHGTIIIYNNGKWSTLEKAIRGNLLSVTSNEGICLIAGGLECFNIPVMMLKKTTGYELTNSYDPDFIELKSIHFSDQTNAWAVGNRGAAFHFDGIHWEKITLPDKLPTLNSVYFTNDNNGIAVGNSGTVLLYSDARWTRENTSVNVKLNGASAFGDMYYAVGNKGTILLYHHKKESDNKTITSTLKAEISSYPNPSSDYINILIPENEGYLNGIITVTNNYGQVLIEKNINSLTSGEAYELNTSNLASGLYMVTIISAGKKTAAGKFIVRH
jgi:photosystem II stability/assembly factor-like uncharacterized protein